MAAALRATLSSSEQERIEKRPTENISAYELYLRADELSESNREENLAAVKMLKQAIQMDPKFALAQDWMAYRTMFQAYWDDPKYLGNL
jgi:hypothetical protein